MLPQIQSLAEKQGVTVECKPSTEKMENGWEWYMGLTSNYKEKSTEIKFPGQYEMACTDVSGKVLSKETSFNLQTFEAWILSDRCNPNIVNSQCYQPGDNHFYTGWFKPADQVTDIWILEVNREKCMYELKITRLKSLMFKFFPAKSLFIIRTRI